MTGKSVYIDTGAYLAYFCKRDQHHSRAYELWNRLEDKQNQTITTNHIIDEVATLLARRINKANMFAKKEVVLSLTAESFISAADKQVQELLAIGSVWEVLS